MSKAKQVRQIRILGILLLGVLATMLAVFVIGPRFTEPNAAQEQATRAISEKAILDVRYIVLGQKAASLDSAKAELEEVSRKYLSNRTQFPLLSSQIYQAGASVGIPAQKIFEPTIDIEATGADGAAQDPAASAGQVVPVTVRLSAEGTLSTLNQLVKALSEMDYTLVIEAIRFHKPAGTTPGFFTLDVTAKAFMLPPVNLSNPAPNQGATQSPAPADPNAVPQPTATETPAVTPSN